MYHSVTPNTNKPSGSGWQQFDEIDFTMSFPQRKLLCNSVRLEADINITTANARPAVGSDIKFDNSIGMHCIIDGIITSFESKGKVESLSKNYSRWAKMLSDVTLTNDDMNQSNNTCELRCPNLNVAQSYCQGQIPNFVTAPAAANLALVTKDADFSLKPHFILNSASSADGDLSLSFSKTGRINVTFILARVLGSFFGGSVNITSKYIVKNPRLTFMSVPEDNKQSNIIFRSVDSFKQTITSNQHSLSVNVPKVVESAVASFQSVSNENQASQNNNATEVLPNLRRLEFLYNNNTNEVFKFPLQSRPEMLKQYLGALGPASHNNASMRNLSANNAFGVGLSMSGGGVDFTNNSFNMMLTSDANSNDSYNVYLYMISPVSI